jgi:hypothetical protein
MKAGEGRRRAALYARYSTDKQSEMSVEDHSASPSVSRSARASRSSLASRIAPSPAGQAHGPAIK